MTNQDLIDWSNKNIVYINFVYDLHESGLNAHAIGWKNPITATSAVERILTFQSREKAIENFKKEALEMFGLQIHLEPVKNSTEKKSDVLEIKRECQINSNMNSEEYFQYMKSRNLVSKCNKICKNKGAKVSHEKHCPICITEIRKQIKEHI